MIIWSSVNCPSVICLPTVCYFSREKPLVKPTAPGSLLYYICPRDLFLFAFIFRSINSKILCCNFYLFILSRIPTRSIYPIYYNFTYLFTREGLSTPLLRQVPSICSLCAGGVYVVLRGSPTGPITLVSSLREIPTIAVLHHPFLFKLKTNARSRSSRKNFWCRCRGDLCQVKTYQVTIINSHLSHYIIFHSPLVFLSPTSKTIFEKIRLWWPTSVWDLS